jgi:hypothetical protein
LLLGARWIERRDEVALTAFCFSAILLAQVRYESVIYLLLLINLESLLRNLQFLQKI